MREAIAAARQAPAHGDVPIGAVLLDASGVVVGAGHNTVERDGDATAHAELHALRQASATLGDKFVGGTLVVTIEPCTMCAGAAVLARVDRIVFGAAEPKTGAVVSLWDVVRDPRLNHRIEVLGPWDLSDQVAAECGELMRTFFRTLR
ncbi:hypothetical protein EK0264_11095 [Epidermidibacterium keratini]|uniref:tRNA-specific adenosine deaminase n=1 Tax=Epidermidibacterium keratini TaxID=1891644 RepID=A0A7L4YTL4_9ACTN|nr:hypothetical protein EK0264_11095 [Epidermidibacterium keratini]